MFVATELLIFSARAPQYLWNSILPAPALVVSVIAGCVIVSVLAGALPFFGALHAQDVLLIWVYDLCCLVVVDAVKVGEPRVGPACSIRSDELPAVFPFLISTIFSHRRF